VQIKISPDRDALIRATADFIVDVANRAISSEGRFTIALSGGGTPKPLYQLLATPPYKQKIDWKKVLVFFGDERCVPPDDAHSNFKMARLALLDHVDIPAENIFRMRGEDDPERAANEYAEDLEKNFAQSTDETEATEPRIRFDLILLGIGDNAHTASLFPGLPGVMEHSRWVLAQYVEVVGMWRLTFTPVVINAARNVAFLVAGADKAPVVKSIVEGPYNPIVKPAQIVKPTHGELYWLLDQGAAAQLQRR
jgi:6-phosphogluconolactonase